MCLDCSEFKLCAKCGTKNTNEHDYKDGRRWQCCGALVKDEPKVPLKLDPPKIEAPVTRAPKRNTRSK